MSTILNFLPAGQYKHVAGTSGGEHAGPCPWCGGTDRFRVWPLHTSGAVGGRYMCRGCGQKGDGIQFLRDSTGLSYPDACRALQASPKPQQGARTAHRPQAWRPQSTSMPKAMWQHKANLFVAECAASMMPGSPGMIYAESRGLTADTVKQLRIGWNPDEHWEKREAWDLVPELNASGNPKKVWLPAGLVIPSYRKAGITAVKIRRNAWTPEDRGPKYVAVAGSVPGLALGCGKDKAVVIVESEIDAVLIWQEAQDLVGALALATATGKPDADTTAYMRSVQRILVALDFDRAGIDAWPWWPRHFPQAKPWPVVQGKDVGDMAGTPGLVRAWIEAAFLPLHGPAKAIKTLDEPCAPQASTPRLEPATAPALVENSAPVGMGACIRAIESVFGPVLVDVEKMPVLTNPGTTPENGLTESRDSHHALVNDTGMDAEAEIAHDWRLEITQDWLEAINPLQAADDEDVTIQLSPHASVPTMQLPEPLPELADSQILCKGCGRPFTPSRPARIYCSARCFNTMSPLLAKQSPIEPGKTRLCPWTPTRPSLTMEVEVVPV